jgi:nuclear respiratory factor 1
MRISSALTRMPPTQFTYICLLTVIKMSFPDPEIIRDRRIMNPSNNNDDQGHMPSSSTHPKQEPMSGDEDTDSEGSFDDDDDDDPMNDHGLSNNISDELAAQLASAGPTGVAAAAAISSTKKRKRPHAFETNPSIRKRQQTRLLRKLRQNIEEYSLRVGQQAVVLVATPGKAQNNFRVFGAKPLEDVVKNLRAVIMSELENALALQAPPMPVEDPTRHEMPPLVIDGIPTPVEKMTQAQLRAFIPLMLKYSTGRGKPGWGKETTKPIWWPKGVPWANVRMDARDADDKQKVNFITLLKHFGGSKSKCFILSQVVF